MKEKDFCTRQATAFGALALQPVKRAPQFEIRVFHHCRSCSLADQMACEEGGNLESIYFAETHACIVAVG